jgi:hypothetical protein
VKFVNAAAQSVRPTRRAFRVNLERRGKAFVGQSEDGASVIDELRHSAEATLEALRQVVGQQTTVALKTVGPVVALGESFILAVVEVTHSGRTHTLLGVCPRSVTPGRDAALAVLSATNRVLGLS